MLVIKNGTIVDGTGRKPFQADILVKGREISAIGNFSKFAGARLIDAKGSYVMPGFIDISANSDHYLTLFLNPHQDDFLLQGITSIIGGQCGSSLAPLLNGSLESIREWSDTNAINVSWRGVGEFLHMVERKKIGVNFGTLVGLSTIRRAIVSHDDRDLTTGEIDRFRSVLIQGLKEGALGCSSGLGYAHSRGVSYHELRNLISVLGAHKGVYTTHLRNEAEGIQAAVQETISLVRETRIPTVINHFRPFMGYESEYSASLHDLETNTASLPLWFNSYPTEWSIAPIYTLLPRWAQRERLEDTLRNLFHAEIRKRILDEISVRGENILIIHAPHAPYLTGKTLAEFAKNREYSVAAGLIELMKITKLRAVVQCRNIQFDMSIQSFASPKALVATHMPSFGTNSKTLKVRREHMFPAYIHLMVRLGYMPIEQAVQRITGIPADLFGIAGRGVITDGNRADIVVMNGESIQEVFVNGVHAVQDGRVVGTRAGEILMRE